MSEFQISITPMPKNCYECPMCVSKGWGDLKDYCHLTNSDIWDMQYRQRKHENCPLKEE